MGKMTFEEAKKYETRSMYFSLKDNGDTARVKILIDGLGDVYRYMVHSVRENGQYKKVPCLRESLGDSVDNCPLCAADPSKKPFIKYYLPIYNLSEDTFQYWERGSSFTQKLVRLCEEYPHVCNEVFLVERVGERNDKNTEYTLENITDEYVNKANARDLDFTLEDLDVPDCMDPEAGIVVEKTFDELAYYAEYGKFEDDTFDYEARERERARNNTNRAERYNNRKDFSESEGYRSRNSYSTRRTINEEEEPVRKRSREF